MACTTQESPGPVHPVDSYRLCQSTTTQSPPKMTRSRGNSSKLQSPTEVKSCFVEWAPAQLILHRGWRLVGSGQCQSLQLTNLGKSLPLTSQQQPRLNYKKRIYSACMKDTPQVPSLGASGGCATGPYRIPTTLGHLHYQDMGSKQFYLIHRNKHREAAKVKRQRNMAQMKEQIKIPERGK